MRLTIAKRLGLLISSALVGIVLLVAAFLYSERVLLMQERQLGLQQAVQTAHGIVSHYYDLAAKGEMSEDDAKRVAIATIKSLRYGTKEYFFIQDFQMKMVMHAASPALDGTDVSGIKDQNGKLLMIDNPTRDPHHG
jgi:methyl-accepting chemotaxis protein